MEWSRHVYLLPVSVFLLIPGTFLITYVIAVLLHHVEADFPYISDTGTYNPEMNIFSQLMNTGALLAAATMFVRYKQVEQYYRDQLSSECLKVRRMNTASIWLGLIASYGLSIVANFQETAVLAVHMTGAILLFGLGSVYVWLQTIISFHTFPLLNTMLMARLRFVLSLIVSVTFITTIIFGSLSLSSYHGIDKTKWFPQDGGFRWHVASSASEWIMAIAFNFFILSYTREFHQIKLDAPKVHFISEEHGLPTTSDNYVSEDQVEISRSFQSL